MTAYELEVLHHLGRELIRLYCHYRGETAGLGLLFVRHSLLLFIASDLKIEVEELPDEQIFYRSCNNGRVGSGNREKFAVLYYIKKEPENAVRHREYLLRILKYERLTATPYWDRFKQEYEQKNAQGGFGELPKPIAEWVRSLREADKRKMWRLLRKELFGK